MPDRMIRDGFKASQRINQLSDRAECLFIRLLTTVDDAGRYYAEPALIKAACWPLKSIRLTDVSRALDELERAGLIAIWTDKEGSRLLCLLRFRQKLQYPRPRFQPPPFDPETGEYRLLQEDDPPPKRTRPKPPKRSEEKRREEMGGERPSRPTPTPHPPESLELALARLRADYPALDLEAEIRAATAYRTRQGKTFNLVWFEKHWLPEATPAASAEELRAALRTTRQVSTASEGTPAEPEGWRDVLEGTTYARGGPFEVEDWAEVCRKPDLRKFIEEEMRNRTTARTAR